MLRGLCCSLVLAWTLWISDIYLTCTCCLSISELFPLRFGTLENLGEKS